MCYDKASRLIITKINNYYYNSIAVIECVLFILGLKRAYIVSILPLSDTTWFDIHGIYNAA